MKNLFYNAAELQTSVDHRDTWESYGRVAVSESAADTRPPGA